MRVEFARLAKEQLRLAQAVYREDSTSRAKRFSAEVARVARLLGRYPNAGHRVHEFRRILLQRFPYSVLYRVDASRVYIMELVHQKQETDYWADDDDD